MIYPKICKRCYWEWNAKSNHPKRCPHCGTTNWSEDKVREIVITRIEPSKWDADLHEIKCECGTDFNERISFDEDEVDCPDCYRRYNTLQILTIEPITNLGHGYLPIVYEVFIEGHENMSYAYSTLEKAQKAVKEKQNNSMYDGKYMRIKKVMGEWIYPPGKEPYHYTNYYCSTCLWLKG